MNVKELAEKIDGLKFDYDWTQDWSESFEDAERRAGKGEEPEVHYTEGEGGWQNIPATATDARDAAKEYEEKVLAAIEEAAWCAEKAASALRRGELDDGLTHLQAAAAEERQFGDAPTYDLYIEALEELIESRDNITEALEAVKAFFELEENQWACPQGIDIWGVGSDPRVDCNNYSYTSALRQCLSGDDLLDKSAASNAGVDLED